MMRREEDLPVELSLSCHASTISENVPCNRERQVSGYNVAAISPVTDPPASCTYRSAQSLLRHKSSDSRHKYESSRLKLVDTTRYIRIQQLKVWFIDLKEVLGNWLAGACCAPISRYCGCLESSYKGSMIQWEVTLILNGMWSFIMSLYRRNVG